MITKPSNLSAIKVNANNKKSLLVWLNANNTPSNKDANKFTKEILLRENPILILKLFSINILNINPKALPIKRKTKELMFKI